MIRKDAGISSLHDLIGRRVWMSSDVRNAELQAIFKNEGIDVTWFHNVADVASSVDYLDQTIDAFGVYMTNEPYYLEQAGIQISFIDPKIYGIDFYGDCLYTSEAEIRRHPERARNFREASLRGWAYAMKHPDEIIDLILTAYGSEKTHEHLAYEANKMRQIILPDFIELGHVNPGRWQHIADTYVALGMVPPDHSLAGFFYNPHPAHDYAWMYWTLGIVSGLLSVTAAGAFLLAQFNRRLQTAVWERTQALRTSNQELSLAIQQRTQVERELRESEELHRVTMMNILDPIFITDDEGRYTFICPNVFHILGYSTEEIQQKGRISALVGGNLFEIEDLTRQGELLNIDGLIIDKHGRKRDFLITVRRVSIQDGTVLYNCRDITERKQMEERIRNQNVMLEQAVQHKQREMEILFERLLRQDKLATIGQIAGSIAHELRNPLGAVKQSVYYLNRLAQQRQLDASNPKVLEHLTLMETELSVSEQVIADLLDMTRMKPPQRVAVNLRAAFADALERCALPERVHVSIEVDPEPMLLQADALQLRQVLINALTNAAQSIEEDGRIILRAKQLTQRGQLCIMISDTGSGMTAETLARAFDPLFTTKAAGTGLGLSICKQIIESHQGQISLNSQVGQGTTVTMIFPDSGGGYA